MALSAFTGIARATGLYAMRSSAACCRGPFFGFSGPFQPHANGCERYARRAPAEIRFRGSSSLPDIVTQGARCLAHGQTCGCCGSPGLASVNFWKARAARTGIGGA